MSLELGSIISKSRFDVVVVVFVNIVKFLGKSPEKLWSFLI